jgi:hypothetical protein
MKVTVEIDCTPEEARAFMGLPDVKPLQAAVMARMEAQMVDSISAMTPDAMLRQWMQVVPAGAEQLRDAFLGLLKPGFGKDR